jgi:aspartate-semialdehyde dehydrogenase
MAKIPVAILGATGAVGQRFVQLLAGHPWFEIVALAASEHSADRLYTDACRWVVPGDPPPSVNEMIVNALEPRRHIPSSSAVSRLAPNHAEIETRRGGWR